MATEPLPLQKTESADPGPAGAPEDAVPAAGSTGEPLVRFDKVVKRYGDHVVLDQLDFTVDRGEHVTLIGPSGSGKTTILRLLMTLEKVSDGVIWVNGSPLSHVRTPGGALKPAGEKQLRESRKKIGMVFQQFNLFPNMKVLQNITEAPISVLGKDREVAEVRARELLELVGLSDKVDAHPSQLSGGQQQRVAVARALASQPDIIFGDEPTGNLDSRSGAEVLGFLRNSVRELGQTVVMVTHDPVAASYADRVIFLADGAVVDQMMHPTADGVLDRMKAFDAKGRTS
ncbi:amino acid ABC transporter ATP-binding protein [Streptomyces sp. MBT57]|nr:amino acid ABC transporter ATP-binding protein [Streptomyces sp. MBT57]